MQGQQRAGIVSATLMLTWIVCLQKLQVPKEIVWLNGAPGSGKGVNTPFILESRSLSRAVTMSSLFQDRDEIREIMDRGELVPDTMVGPLLVSLINHDNQGQRPFLCLENAYSHGKISVYVRSAHRGSAEDMKETYIWLNFDLFWGL